jgi:hypothetical protein
MALISQRIIKLDVSEIVTELKRLNYNLEKIFQVDSKEITPVRDFDPDDFSSVSYSDEVEELVQQHLDKNIGGVRIS